MPGQSFQAGCGCNAAAYMHCVPVRLPLERANPPATLQVTLSVVEIYLERIKDLLDPGKDNLQARPWAGVGCWGGVGWGCR